MPSKNSRRIQNRIDHLFESLASDLEGAKSASSTNKKTTSTKSKSLLDEFTIENVELVKPVFEDFPIPSPEPGHDQKNLQPTKKTKKLNQNLPFGYRIRQNSVDAIQSLSDEIEEEDEIFLGIPIHRPEPSHSFEVIVRLKGVKNNEENRNFASKILSQLAMIINYSGLSVD